MISLQSLRPKFVGRLWPNGEFGVSRVRETPFLLEASRKFDVEERRWQVACIKIHGIEAALAFQATRFPERQLPGSSMVSKPHKAPRGTKGITSHGRKVVRNACFHLERMFPRSVLSFGTTTVPGCSLAEARQVALGWGEITRRFLQSLRRDLRAAGLYSEVVLVTEIQQRRFESSGIPALHLHFCFVGRLRRGSAWLVDRNSVRDAWHRALSPYLAPDTDFSSTENVVAVRKSIEGYLGKYMSKGAKVVQALISEGFEEFLPRAWWQCSYALRRAVLSAVLRSEYVGEVLMQLCEGGFGEFLAYLNPVKIKSKSGYEYVIGYCGRISRDSCDDFYTALSRSTVDTTRYTSASTQSVEAA